MRLNLSAGWEADAHVPFEAGAGRGGATDD